MPTPETPYTETEALLAVMNEDPERLQGILDGMHRKELREFFAQVTDLQHAIARAMSR